MFKPQHSLKASLPPWQYLRPKVRDTEQESRSWNVFSTSTQLLVGEASKNMVVLSAAVTSKSGKALVSRQFVEMTRIRIEGLLAAFPKLISSDGKQHTYIETESVRYLYQPIDNLFLLLVTNRASNIVEDLETLRLLSKVVPDVVGVSNNISEDRIAEKCFDLIFAFDEVSV